MVKLYTKFEATMFTHYDDMKGSRKCRILVVRGLGLPKVPVMSPFNRVHMNSYLHLIETMHLSDTVYCEYYIETET